LVLLVAQPVPPGPPQPTGPQRLGLAEGPAGWRDHFDELWKVRDQPGVEKEMEEVLLQHLAVESRSFEANWRLASLYNWMADGKEDDDAKAALGKKAWEAGDKAIAANAGEVRGHYNAAVGIGQYAEGVGMISALSQGLEGKFRDRILTALRLAQARAPLVGVSLGARPAGPRRSPPPGTAVAERGGEEGGQDAQGALGHRP
jgi:hypothetical protein